MSGRTDSPGAKLHTDVEGLANTELRNLTLEAIEWANTKALAEENMERIKTEVKSILSAFSVSYSVIVKDAARKWVPAKGKTTRKLSLEKLWKLGVPAATTDAATETTVGEPSLRLTTIEEDDAGQAA